jgi:hypothetical protein
LELPHAIEGKRLSLAFGCARARTQILQPRLKRLGGGRQLSPG